MLLNKKGNNMSYAAKLLLIFIPAKLNGERATLLTEDELRHLQFDIASQIISGNLDKRLQ